VLAFVEVKTRSSADFGAPDAAVDQENSAGSPSLAREYGYRAQVEAARTRFDIVSIMLASPPQIAWRRDAFRVVTYNQVFAVVPTWKEVPDCLSCAKTRSPAAG